MATADQLLFALTLFAALGCGLMAGVFFAFSAFVMKALARLPTGDGIAAMQSVNVAVFNPLFMGVFFGTAGASVLALISSLLRWQEPGAVYLFVGGALYPVGTLLVTIVFNVPKNEALASVAPADPGGASLWADYVGRWTAWNHVRTAAALARRHRSASRSVVERRLPRAQLPAEDPAREEVDDDVAHYRGDRRRPRRDVDERQAVEPGLPALVDHADHLPHREPIGSSPQSGTAPMSSTSMSRWSQVRAVPVNA